MHRRNNRIVLRYHKPSENLFPEDLAHLMLMICYPLFNEINLKLNDSCLSKINSEGVLNIIKRNRDIFEPASNIEDHYWVHMQNHSETKEKLLFTAIKFSSMETNSVVFENISFPTATHQPENVDVDSLVNSLNLKQRAIFNVVAYWARKKANYSNSVTPKNVKSLNLFITGAAGVRN